MCVALSYHCKVVPAFYLHTILNLFEVPASLIYPTQNGVEHTVVEGERYELRCTANGIPLPEVTWLKDGRSVNNIKNLRVRRNRPVVNIVCRCGLAETRRKDGVLRQQPFTGKRQRSSVGHIKSRRALPRGVVRVHCAEPRRRRQPTDVARSSR